MKVGRLLFFIRCSLKREERDSRDFSGCFDSQQIANAL